MRWLLVTLLSVQTGCISSLWTSGKSTDLTQRSEAVADTRPETRLIGDLTRSVGMNYFKVENVGLVTNLLGSGSDPPASRHRGALLGEMQSHKVDSPNRLLASPNTSLVLVRGFIPPGAKKGDRFDVEVYLPTQSQTKSLYRGWLMRTRLREVAVVNNTVHSGHVASLAGGPLLLLSLFRGADDQYDTTRALILGGGEVRTGRSMGLNVTSDYSSIRTSSRIGAAINARFHGYRRGAKRGLATPQRDNYIALDIHTRYRNNISRYLNVIQSIAVSERPEDRIIRMELLGRQLLDPATAFRAALQLEALGKESVALLKAGLLSVEADVRFYAAEALAYLDEEEAAPVLAQLAESEPAFRWHAMAALSAMDHVSSLDALTGLLDVTSAETRNGAFQALRARNPDSPLSRGTNLADFYYHVVSTKGPPMVHFSMARRPEIVVYGHGQTVNTTGFFYAGPSIMIRRLDAQRLKITRFTTGQPDQVETCAHDLASLIRGIVNVGGGYSEILQGLQEAKNKGYTTARLLVGARPKRGRTYHRVTDGVNGQDSRTRDNLDAASPVPELFENRLLTPVPSKDGHKDQEKNVPQVAAGESENNFFGTMKSWFSW
ncbi:MAG: flagellar basal body P-ring protein FlgI [Pirellulaceae bacterium]